MKSNLFQARERLLRKAWENAAGGAVPHALPLSGLIDLMRDQSRDQQSLASLYFAGLDVDHPFFIENDAVAIGIAVLPEDNEKAKTRKRHPHQTEVIFVLEGAIRLHYVEDGSEHSVSLAKGDCHVIGKDVCHWIHSENEMKSTFLFVKTNPGKEPRGVLC